MIKFTAFVFAAVLLASTGAWAQSVTPPATPPATPPSGHHGHGRYNDGPYGANLNTPYYGGNLNNGDSLQVDTTTLDDQGNATSTTRTVTRNHDGPDFDAPRARAASDYEHANDPDFINNGQPPRQGGGTNPNAQFAPAPGQTPSGDTSRAAYNGGYDSAVDSGYGARSQPSPADYRANSGTRSRASYNGD